jgi:hypothetical protein
MKEGVKSTKLKTIRILNPGYIAIVESFAGLRKTPPPLFLARARQRMKEGEAIARIN